MAEANDTMSRRHATLVFVAGPQAGQRVVLSRPVAIHGRGSGADVLLSEDFASRRQARYELLRAGPTLESLSPRGTWVNGKLYKAGKKLLLDTGDLIGVGVETEILFVAAGDDPETALAVHAQAVPPKSAFGRKHRGLAQPKGPEAEAPPPEPVEEGLAPDELDEGPRRRRPSEMTPAERAELEDKAKRKKTMIGLGIYLAVMLIIGAIIYVARGPGESGTPIPYMLTPAEIRAALAGRIEKSPNPVKKESKLQEALELYQQHGLEPLYLHKCLVAFKESLAYSGREFFDDPEDGDKYKAVLNELIKVVRERYRNAYMLERDKHWERAGREFGSLLLIVPDRNNPIFGNVQKHYGRVKGILQKEEAKKKRGPLG